MFDADWSIIIDKLGNALDSSKKLDTVCVIFDLDTMEGFKQRPKRVHNFTYCYSASIDILCPDAFPGSLRVGAFLWNPCTSLIFYSARISLTATPGTQH